MNPEETKQPETTQPEHKPTSTVGNDTIFGILSYLGPLIIIPFLMSKHVPFVKFHIKQGAVLFTIQLIVWVLSMFTMFPLSQVTQIIHLGIVILIIIGIVRVIQHKEDPLPLIGHFSKYFTF